MSRRERRAAAARAKTALSAAPADIAALMADADYAHRQSHDERAEIICRQILESVPAHKLALNLLGLIYQGSGRHRLAVKQFADAISSDDLDAVSHYNIAGSHLALGRRDQAAAHLRTAIALGMGEEKHVEEYLMQSPVIVGCVARVTDRLNSPLKQQALFDQRDLAAIADDLFLRCALESTLLHGVSLELFLTHLRSALLGLADANLSAPSRIDDEVTGLFCALAQQCFLNEYVFAQSEAESRTAARLRDVLMENVRAGTAIAPLLLAAVAAYFPLHALAAPVALLHMSWPVSAAGLIRQQVREPLEEREDRDKITALTPIQDRTSLHVREQYEENPYPRWTTHRLAALSEDTKKQRGAAHSHQSGPIRDILIAGCGSGQHSIEMAQYFPDARVLAIDISLTGLAYARRKTRELGLRNIEYAQADILELGVLGRSFDRIGTIGVLHHLTDPLEGWGILLSLLRPGGVMRVGLYSERARRPVIEARELIAECGYGATGGEIREFRQMIMRNWHDPRWRMLLNNGDFYSMSGCRDLLFNVMEHRYTIPRIAAFLDEQGLSFLGFELDDSVIEKFQRQYSGADALTDLECWNTFEAANPHTFRSMYTFSVCWKTPALR
jgi:SAM-dependent methyltransferase